MEFVSLLGQVNGGLGGVGVFEDVVAHFQADGVERKLGLLVEAVGQPFVGENKARLLIQVQVVDQGAQAGYKTLFG